MFVIHISPPMHRPTARDWIEICLMSQRLCLQNAGVVTQILMIVDFVCNRGTKAAFMQPRCPAADCSAADHGSL